MIHPKITGRIPPRMESYLHSTLYDVGFDVGNDVACCHDPSVGDSWWADRYLLGFLIRSQRRHAILVDLAV